MAEKTHVLLTWQVPEFIKQEKTPSWTFGVVILAVIVILAGIFKNDITVIFLAIFAGLALWLFGKKEPKMVTFKIRADGIQIDNFLYAYRNLHSFWIFQGPDHPNELVVRSDHVLNPLLFINIEGQDTEEIKKILAGHLPEKEEIYPIAHFFARIMGY